MKSIPLQVIGKISSNKLKGSVGRKFQRFFYCLFNSIMISIMGFLFESKKKKEKIIAIFDIGSGSIGGAIVKIPTNGIGLPIILKSTRFDIKSQNDINFDFLMNNMLKALHSTANSLLHLKVGSPEEIFCVLTSPWYLSETRTIKIERGMPFVFKNKLANKLILKEIQDLDQLYKEKYENEGVPDIIEQQITSVILDGLLEENPIGKKCTNAEMNMIVSLSPSIFIDKIKETISRTFHTTNIEFSSFTISSYLAIREKYISNDSYLLVDINGEITDVGIVIEGVLKSIISFPFGKKTFYKQICNNLEIDQREAREFISLYNDGNLLSSHNKRVIEAIKSVESSWNQSFERSLGLFSRYSTIPKIAFLTIDEDLRRCFINVLGSFRVETLSGNDFLNMCSVDEGACDPFLMIESIAVMRKINK